MLTDKQIVDWLEEIPVVYRESSLSENDHRGLRPRAHRLILQLDAIHLDRLHEIHEGLRPDDAHLLRHVLTAEHSWSMAAGRQST